MYSRRSRGRGGARKGGAASENRVIDSNSPDAKVRGNLHQVWEKYLSLARDAAMSGDRILAEGYYQHAEHYYRVMVANGGLEQRSVRPPGQQQDRQPTLPNRENAQQSSQAPEVEGANQQVVSADGGSATIDEPERRISAEEGDLNNSEAEAIIA